MNGGVSQKKKKQEHANRREMPNMNPKGLKVHVNVAHGSHVQNTFRSFQNSRFFEVSKAPSIRSESAAHDSAHIATSLPSRGWVGSKSRG